MIRRRAAPPTTGTQLIFQFVCPCSVALAGKKIHRFMNLNVDTHTHTHTYIYIYICM